jgi:hypothetical protein
MLERLSWPFFFSYTPLYYQTVSDKIRITPAFPRVYLSFLSPLSIVEVLAANYRFVVEMLN